ncbi:MAG: IclR family transcriptional regulator [Actinobacteria bacterium]|nr:IclR family transcriptional regulator [Actinomycetota bacterium]
MSNALERGLDVLELLAGRGDVRVIDVMDALEVSRATAFRILATLETRGYVQHVRDQHVWRLGPSVGELAVGLDSTSIMQLAAPALADLRATSRETVNLAVLHRNRVVWAASFDGAFALRLSTTIGAVVPLHATAIGKAILSVMPEEHWSRLLPPEPYPALTPQTHRTVAELRPGVRACQVEGWAVDEEESEVSGVCVAAPITGRDGRPVGAISVSSVAGRLTVDARPPVGRAVQGWCEKISAELRAGAAAPVGEPDSSSPGRALSIV